MAKKELVQEEERPYRRNLGTDWEKQIIKKCEQYRKQGVAYIHKIPTEFSIVRRFGKIVGAFPKDKSILDFIGTLADGRSIYIEAKSTQNKTSFPLSLIKDHQYDFAKEILNYTDLCFYLIYFRTRNRVYLLHVHKVETFKRKYTRKSLPLDWIEKFGIELDVADIDFMKPILKKYKIKNKEEEL